MPNSIQVPSIGLWTPTVITLMFVSSDPFQSLFAPHGPAQLLACGFAASSSKQSPCLQHHFSDQLSHHYQRSIVAQRSSARVSCCESRRRPIVPYDLVTIQERLDSRHQRSS